MTRTGVGRGAGLALAILGTMIGSAGLCLAHEAPVRTARQEGQIARIRNEVATGTRSCVRIVGSYLARIERLDPHLRSLISLDPAALEKAQALDRLSQEERRSRLLLCTPVLVKDNIDVAGLPTTAGSVALAGNIAQSDAPAVARLVAAGAIVLGKTNMSEFAFHFRGISSIRGQARSPFSDGENAGGSSSGNGAALGAGLAVAALGTDTSGSLRVPAALTGTIGLRPSFGTVPMAGVVPLSPSQDTVGPMCRNVADCAQVLAVLTGRRAGTGARGRLNGLRVGVLRDEFDTADPSAAVAQTALDALRAAGAQVFDVRLRDEAVLTGQAPPAAERAKFASRSAFDFAPAMDRYLSQRGIGLDGADALLERLRRLEDQGRENASVVADVATFIANWQARAHDPRFRVNGPWRDAYVASRIDEAYSCAPGRPCVDFLVYPTVRSAYARLESVPRTGGTHRFAAYSGRPAIAFPVGYVMTAKGLRPVALEAMGRRGDDARLMDFVDLWQERVALGSVVDCKAPGASVCLEGDPSGMR